MSNAQPQNLTQWGHTGVDQKYVWSTPTLRDRVPQPQVFHVQYQYSNIVAEFNNVYQVD